MSSKNPIRKVQVEVMTGGPGHCSDQCRFLHKTFGRCSLYDTELKTNPKRKRNTRFRADACMLNDVGGEIFANRVK